MKNKEKQICMNCLEFCEDKDIYWVHKDEHQVLYCKECIDKNKIDQYVPYVKVRKKK